MSGPSHKPTNVPHAGFVLFQCEDDWTNTSPELPKKCSSNNLVVEKFSGHKAEYFRVRNDPKKLVHLAGWDSLERHFEDFHHSKEIGHLFGTFGGVVDILSHWHTDLDWTKLRSQLDTAPYTSVIRIHVLASKMDAFVAHLPGFSKEIEGCIKNTVFTGWRCDGGWTDKDETADYLQEYAPETRRQHHEDGPQETVEWNIIFPWASWEEHDEITGDKERFKPFLDLFVFAARMEVLWLEPMELPPVDPHAFSDSDAEETDESESESEEEDEYEGSEEEDD